MSMVDGDLCSVIVSCGIPIDQYLNPLQVSAANTSAGIAEAVRGFRIWSTWSNI